MSFTLFPDSIASEEFVGQPSLTKFLYPGSVSTSETVGQPSLTKILYPSSIGSAESFGTSNAIKSVTPVAGSTQHAASNVTPVYGYLTESNRTYIGVRTFGYMYTDAVEFGSDEAPDDEYDGAVISATVYENGVPVVYPTLKVAELHQMNIRAIPVTRATVPDPVFFRGIPVVPRVLCQNTPGSSGDGAHDPNPDDSDDDAHIWKVGDLISPGDTEYWLEDWQEAGGGLSWNSVYPYRPRVHKRYEFFDDETEHIYTKSLSFNYEVVEHMWLDLGSSTNQMTVIVAAMIQRHAKNSFAHHIFDSGKATPVRTGVLDGKSYKIDDGLDYRAAIVAERGNTYTSSSNALDYTTAKNITAKIKAPRMPKVLFTVFNGSNSLHGSISPGKGNRVIKSGSLASKSYRHLVLGRSRNRISSDYASDMSVFEVRVYERALSKAELIAKSKRIMGRYKFNKYWD